ncbi:hypothetical protein WIW50_02390 [Flavobacteriaceae bacterium 3-367]
MSHQKSFNTLYRSCLRELFCLIESDLYNLNSLDEYHCYSDFDRFLNKFKKTFKQVCSTWEKEDIQKRYFNVSLEKLKDVKLRRDKVTHPKSPNDLNDATIDDLERVKMVFEEYTLLVSNLMDGFFVGMKNYPT